MRAESSHWKLPLATSGPHIRQHPSSPHRSVLSWGKRSGHWVPWLSSNPHAVGSCNTIQPGFPSTHGGVLESDHVSRSHQVSLASLVFGQEDTSWKLSLHAQGVQPVIPNSARLSRSSLSQSESTLKPHSYTPSERKALTQVSSLSKNPSLTQ